MFAYITKKCYLCRKITVMLCRYATYKDAAELLLCSEMTARRRLANMRNDLGLKPYARVTMKQLRAYVQSLVQ